MTTYRLFPSASGPADATSYGGSFLAGVLIEVTQGGMWFEGYWWWVGNGSPAQPVSAQKFALWNVTGGSSGTVIPGSVVTSGTLTAGQWNYIPLATPIQLAIGTCYNACTGFTGNFPSTAAQFGSGDPYAAGITSGPLVAYSDTSGSSPSPYGTAQGVFGTSGSDPGAAMPVQGSSSSNFWMDAQVSDTAPSGYAGTYRLWPSKYDTNQYTTADAAQNYIIATEVHLSQACTLNRIWYYSPGGTSQLATRTAVWGILPQAEVAVSASPSWSGAAGSGWVSCSFSGVTLDPGSYRVSVYSGAVSPDQWSAKDSTSAYWASGAGANGITSGPLTAPDLLAASLCWEYNAGDSGASPPYSNGIQEPGQSSFGLLPSGGNAFPQLYVDGLAQIYWVDAEVTPVPAAAPPVQYLYSMRTYP